MIIIMIYKKKKKNNITKSQYCFLRIIRLLKIMVIKISLSEFQLRDVHMYETRCYPAP